MKGFRVLIDGVYTLMVSGELNSDFDARLWVPLGVGLSTVSIGVWTLLWRLEREDGVKMESVLSFTWNCLMSIAFLAHFLHTSLTHTSDKPWLDVLDTAKSIRRILRCALPHLKLSALAVFFLLGSSAGTLRSLEVYQVLINVSMKKLKNHFS